MKKNEDKKSEQTVGSKAKAQALEKLRIQREKLNARIRKMEASEKVKERKQDVRYWLGPTISTKLNEMAALLSLKKR